MWLRSSTIVLLFLVAIRAQNSRNKRQLSQERQLHVEPLLDSILSLQHEGSSYQFPLPPQAKIRSLQLSPEVKANAQTISHNQYNQPPRLQYQPPIHPQQTSTQTLVKFRTSPQKHQYVPPSFPEFQQQPYHSNNYTQYMDFKQGAKTQEINSNDQSTVMHVPLKESPTRQHGTISTSHSTEVILHDKIGSMQPPVQSVIEKLPASEIESSKDISAMDKDSKLDQYVIYYYYYDDDNKTNVTNPTLNFDDISNLEVYDQIQENSQPEKSNIRTNIPQNTNKAFKSPSSSSTLQPVTVLSQATGQEEIIDTSVTRAPKTDVTTVSEGSLVSNIYRYGNNVPRFPSTPNLVNHPIKNQPEISNRGIPYDRKSSSDAILPSIGDVNSDVPISTLSYTSTLLTNVEPKSERKFEDINEVIETKTEPETTETPTTTTVEPTTTTEEPTTTEKRRQRTFSFRRSSGFKKRRPGSLRQRRPSSTATTTESTTTQESSTKGLRSRFGSKSFRRSRFRSSFRRNRFGHSNDDDDDEKDKEEEEVTEEETTTESSRRSKRRRYRGSRRYGRRRTSSRISKENTEETSTTDEVTKEETTTESSRGSKRQRYRGSRRYGRRRTSSRISTENTEETSTTESYRSRPSVFNRRKTPSRPRLPFFSSRKRFGHHDEEEKEQAVSSLAAAGSTPETTISTPASTESADENYNKTDNVEEQTTTTEKNRFAGLFKRRKRPTLFG
ncbi:uncharacterized protein LOC143234359 [Tachypleus tridentatus]|uniref:uncharacterized protein LOC143234359 n=1 Tax=Tachypleus tridentatus TaxID=6853 RepID=UPI003FD1DFFC